MDGLRLALIIFGVIVVAVVYLWTARRRRLDREAGDFDRFDAWTDEGLDPLAPVATDADPGTHAGPNARSTTGTGVSNPVFDDDVVDADDLTQPNWRLSAADDAAQGLANEPHRTHRAGGLDDDENARVSGSARLNEGEVIDDLEAIAASLDARTEPSIGTLHEMVLGDASSGPAMHTSKSHSGPLADESRSASVTGASVRRGESFDDGRHGKPDEESKEHGDTEELVVVLNVMAGPDKSFDGRSLKQALEGAGLKPGDMQLYDYRGDTQAPDTPPIFSALNTVKPGTLGVSEFDGMHTPGIALILRMPGLERPSESFELMLVTARRIAEELGGQVCDDSRSTLTGQALNHLRERIAAAVFRARAGSQGL